jgi:hypothetical protein
MLFQIRFERFGKLPLQDSISNKTPPCGSFVAFRTVAVVEGSAVLSALLADSTSSVNAGVSVLFPVFGV